MPGRRLTMKQSELLTWTRSFVEREGRRPLLREAATAFSVTVPTMSQRWKAIRAAGWGDEFGGEGALPKSWRGLVPWLTGVGWGVVVGGDWRDGMPEAGSLVVFGPRTTVYRSGDLVRYGTLEDGRPGIWIVVPGDANRLRIRSVYRDIAAEPVGPVLVHGVARVVVQAYRAAGAGAARGLPWHDATFEERTPVVLPDGTVEFRVSAPPPPAEGEPAPDIFDEARQ